jgi:hypothetical protein
VWGTADLQPPRPPRIEFKKKEGKHKFCTHADIEGSTLLVFRLKTAIEIGKLLANRGNNEKYINLLAP